METYENLPCIHTLDGSETTTMLAGVCGLTDTAFVSQYYSGAEATLIAAKYSIEQNTPQPY